MPVKRRVLLLYSDIELVGELFQELPCFVDRDAGVKGRTAAVFLFGFGLLVFQIFNRGFFWISNLPYRMLFGNRRFFKEICLPLIKVFKRLSCGFRVVFCYCFEFSDKAVFESVPIKTRFLPVVNALDEGKIVINHLFRFCQKVRLFLARVFRFFYRIGNRLCLFFLPLDKLFHALHFSVHTLFILSRREVRPSGNHNAHGPGLSLKDGLLMLNVSVFVPVHRFNKCRFLLRGFDFVFVFFIQSHYPAVIFVLDLCRSFFWNQARPGMRFFCEFIRDVVFRCSELCVIAFCGVRLYWLFIGIKPLHQGIKSAFFFNSVFLQPTNNLPRVKLRSL